MEEIKLERKKILRLMSHTVPLIVSD